MSARVPATAAGAATSSVSTMTSNTLGMARATLAAAFRAGGGQRPAHPGRPVLVRVSFSDGLAARGAQPRAQLRVAAQPRQRGGERVVVAGGDDESRLLVADEPARGGSHGCACDHRHPLVERLVHHQPPRLEEVARGDRRHYDDVGAGVEAADALRRERAFGHGRAGGDGPGSERTVADHDERDFRCLEAQGAPGPQKHREPLFPLQAAGKHDLERGVPARFGRRAPERVIDALGRLHHRGGRSLRAHVGGHVRPVGGDRVGVAVDVAQRQVGERVRRGSGMTPDRRPEDERHARLARAEVGGRERDAAGEAGDDRAVAAGRGELEDAALARPDRGERVAGGRDRAAVADAAAEEREDDALGLVQRGERAGAERGRVVGYEQNRARVGAHRSAASYAATVARPHCSHVNAASTVARAASPSSRRQPGSSSSARNSAASASGSPGATSRRPPPAAAISSGPGSPRQPIAGTAPAIASTYATPNASSTLGSTNTPAVCAAVRASAGGSWPWKRTRPSSSNSFARRSSAARSGPSPITSYATSGWLSRSSHSARRTSPWRLRATRWPTLTSVAVCRSCGSGRSVPRCTTCVSRAPSSRARRAIPREFTRTIRAFSSPRRTARLPAREPRATDRTSPPCTETTTGTPARARRTPSPAGAA